MGAIGSLGNKIVFETNDKKILNFNNFQQEVTGRWTDHNMIGKKAKKEFLGPGNRSLSFTVVLDATHGVRPRRTMETIEKMVENGEANKLVINGSAVGKNNWVIVSMSEAWDTILTKGELLKATLTLNLEEYA